MKFKIGDKVVVKVEGSICSIQVVGIVRDFDVLEDKYQVENMLGTSWYKAEDLDIGEVEHVLQTPLEKHFLDINTIPDEMQCDAEMPPGWNHPPLEDRPIDLPKECKCSEEFVFFFGCKCRA